MTTDASDFGCGACLSFVDEAGQERVVAYASKTLSPAERNYSTVEKEALACVWATEKWRHYLWGRRFLLRTDHQALCTILGPKGSNRVGRRIARWEARLMEYSFDVEYISSSANSVADGLSRLPVAQTQWEDDDEIEIAALTESAAISEAEMVNASAADEDLRAVRQLVQGCWPQRRREVGGPAATFFHVRSELSSQGPLLFRGEQLVVPTALRGRVLANAHSGHQGIARTKQRLRERFWWPGMDAEVRSQLRECGVCSRHDEHAKVTRPPLQAIPLPETVWQRVMVDIIGPMKGPQTERYGIVLCDLYSRWPEVALCADVTASTVINLLEAVFSREGVPEELISDNGPQFRSAALAAYLRRLGVRHVFSSPYSPQTCGLVERTNRTVKGAIQSARLAGESRASFVRKFLREYRATPHPATGISPFLAMRGREARTPVDVFPVPGPSADGVQRDRQVRRHFNQYQEGYRRRHDRSAGQLPTWRKGDWVRLRQPVSGRIEAQEPVQIQRRTGPVSYRLSTGERVHARRLVRGEERQGVSMGNHTTLLDAVEAPTPSVPDAAPVPGSAPLSPPPAASEPVTPLTQPARTCSPRRSSRVSRAPNRYSP